MMHDLLFPPRENVRSEITALKEEVQGLSAVNDRICRERDEAVAIRSSLQASLQAVEIERCVCAGLVSVFLSFVSATLPPPPPPPSPSPSPSPSPPLV